MDEGVWKPFKIFCIIILVIMVLFTAYSSATYWSTAQIEERSTLND